MATVGAESCGKMTACIELCDVRVFVGVHIWLVGF